MKLHAVLLACAVVLAGGCGGSRVVAGPGPGHPAWAGDAAVAYATPENPFAAPIEPLAQTPADAMPGMNMESGGLTIYACPMHADVRSDRPGDCPKCGMSLKPTKAPAAPAPGEHRHGGTP